MITEKGIKPVKGGQGKVLSGYQAKKVLAEHRPVCVLEKVVREIDKIAKEAQAYFIDRG